MKEGKRSKLIENHDNMGDRKMNSKIKKCLEVVNISALLIVVVLTTISGCTKRSGQSSRDERYITIKGSDTMVHLVSNWAEAFMQQNPGIEVSVTGGGSGTGIAALINGTTDICAASRRIKEQELRLVIQRNIHPNEIVVARDGIAVVVNPDNPITELTMDKLSKIFTGKDARWSDVGGPDEEIVVMSRESSSGTYVFFQEIVLKKQDYMTDAKLLPATSAIIELVSNDKWAIGYVGLGYALAAKDKVKMVGVKADDKSPAVLPSEQTVKSGEYPIARPLYFYLNGQSEGILKKFVDFCLSREGQKIVEQTGYVAVQ
jgi:phosphate transport system substrate-binding protein